MIDSSGLEQVMVCPDGCEFDAFCLEAALHTLRKHGRVEIRVRNGHVPSACELAISALNGVGVDVSVTAADLIQMNRRMREALV